MGSWDSTKHQEVWLFTRGLMDSGIISKGELLQVHGPSPFLLR